MQNQRRPFKAFGWKLRARLDRVSLLGTAGGSSGLTGLGELRVPRRPLRFEQEVVRREGDIGLPEHVRLVFW